MIEQQQEARGIDDRLRARAAVWLAELADAFRVWGFSWAEPERQERSYRPYLGDEVVLSWKRDEVGKHLTVVLEQGEEPDSLIDIAYYGFGPDLTERDVCGHCWSPRDEYLLFYWFFD